MGHASMGYHYGGYPGGMAVVPPSQCAAAAVSLGSSELDDAGRDDGRQRAEARVSRGRVHG
jgi:hypothetical protein